MEKPVIEINHISKKYDINRKKGSYITLRDVLTGIFKNPFRFFAHKTKEAVASFKKKEDFWALKDVSFDVKRGEVIGIIGANGAGKSTLLKILSQITPPTEGEVIIRGRVGSLLEVGTGFHPELSGRDNIFLNGAILGMHSKEVAAKFTEIVEFAGIGQFLDTPVKYYSSGMYVRLAFSVAAHMDPDILIVDEVLAVGDAEFQKKCLGKMEEVTEKEGRTILFVSHNLDAIERLCDRTVLLKKGKVVKVGETRDVIDYYLETDRNLNAVTEFPVKDNPEGQILKVSVLNKDEKPQPSIPLSEKFFIEVEFVVKKKITKKLVIFHFYYQGELLLVSTEGDADGKYRDYEPGHYRTRIEVPAFLFQTGTITMMISLKHFNEARSGVDIVRDISFDITNENVPRQPIWGDMHFGKVSTMLHYKTTKTD